MRKNKLLTAFIGFALLATLTQCFTKKKNEGEKLYTANCASCHMDDGSGLRGVIPPIAGSDYLVKHRRSLACLIRHGQAGEITVNGQKYNQAMPGVEHLNDGQILNLLNYIQTNFGNKNERYTLVEVKSDLEICPSH
ncbi:c-type cytochrome [Pontibacter vulgaris]|uniref:c-type cytochrome n=1 Tax=Pontibacter vulgaris TaxID=2905679 RepID=UPI001FA7CA6B|nr:cytochrome c [Pontibacter vulgaris]